ncbi:hypothetical protein [Azotosporobacter soli]|uniref:YobI family P-loop NTPase n=1 Tax=Azotosporobacter soli TaxID=3055040 RepID=UPI0031FF126D
MRSNRHHFQKLTPVGDVKLEIYNEALDFVFADGDVKNIAISGPYSSGKSSVLESYKNMHKEINFINISLACFEPMKVLDKEDLEEAKEKETGEKTKTPKAPKKAKTGNLEGKIINQLVHQIDIDKIPQTNFKVKEKVARYRVEKNTAVMAAFLLLIVYLLKFKEWSQFVQTLSSGSLKEMLLWTTYESVEFGAGAVLGMISIYIIYSIVKVQKNRNVFKKIKLQGHEIEMFENGNEDCFDKHLDEILYLFENAGCGAVVFEDLDRYNMNSIFEKLREINVLVNSNRKKPIRFFYLIRDDIFESKDRTKFFDFIIPIVPIIDGSNAYDQFIEHFKQGKIYEKFEPEFLQGLSLYIDDMRMLKNIYNEFVIYHDRIQKTEPDYNKLLALIAYKNIFPKDFNDLQLGMGYIYTLFETKVKHIEEKSIKIDSEIEKIKEDIEKINNENLNSLEEVETILFQMNGPVGYIGGAQVPANTENRKLIQMIKKNPTNVAVWKGGGWNSVNMTEAIAKVQKNPEYIDRKKSIEGKSAQRKRKLEIEVEKLKQQKARLESQRLQDFIDGENIDEVFSVTFTNEIGETNKFEEIKANPYFPMIKYIIRNGHIDETYSDYMTYFYENSLSRTDKIFLRSIADEKAKPHSYAIENPQKIIDRLKETDFERNEILNFKLLAYLLQTKKENGVFLNRIMQQIKDKKNYEFIAAFLANEKDIAAFIEMINRLWPSALQGILTESEFGEAQKKRYIINTLYYSSPKDIEALNEEECLAKFIADDPAFLEMDNPQIDKIIKGLTVLEVEFTRIDYNVVNKEIFQEVYKNDRYQLNFELVSLMLEVNYQYAKNDDFKNKNYTLIASKPDEPLALRVERDIEQYMEIMLVNCEGIILDEEVNVLAILNNEKVKDDVKKKYINFLQTMIEEISSVANHELWGALLQQNIVKYSETNVLAYFMNSDKEIDDNLIDFINGNEEVIEFNRKTIDKRFGDGLAEKFYRKVTICDALENDKYEKILVSLEMQYKKFAYQEIDDEKISILINHKIIRMTAENLIFMREFYPRHIVAFIKKNIDEYSSETINAENANEEELVMLLEEEIEDKYKIDVLKYIKREISIKEKNYSEALKIAIFQKNLDVADLANLVEIYSHESEAMQAAIRKIAEGYVEEIIEENHSLSEELLVHLLEVEEILLENKQKLLAQSLRDMNEDQAKKCLEILRMHDFMSLFHRKRPKFEISSINERLLEIFKEKRWITKFYIDEKENGYYRAIGR